MIHDSSVAYGNLARDENHSGVGKDGGAVPKAEQNYKNHCSGMSRDVLHISEFYLMFCMGVKL
jgi:hypothetical protein